MKQTLTALIGLTVLTMAVLMGCESGVATKDIKEISLPKDPGGTAPSAGGAVESSPGETDTVTPPTTGGTSTEEPPALPTPVKGPGAEEPVYVISDKAVELVAPYTPPTVIPSVVAGVALASPASVDSPEGKGTATGGFSTKTFRCGEGQAATGFDYAKLAIGVECKSGETGGCAADLYVGALKILCSPLSISGVDNAKSIPAMAWPTGETVAGREDAAMDSDPAKTNCKAGSGIASGVFGRVDAGLRSFGFSCGHFHAWREGVALLPTFNKTYSCDDYQDYACSPGFDGSPFATSCGGNQALVGIQLRTAADRVVGVEALLCADLKPVTMKPIFPTE